MDIHHRYYSLLINHINLVILILTPEGYGEHSRPRFAVPGPAAPVVREDKKAAAQEIQGVPRRH